MPGFPKLICPVDNFALECSDSNLICSNAHAYTVSNGIPRILELKSNYADAFGQQWNQYRLTQLDSFTRTTISEDRLRRCLGVSLINELNNISRLELLETGCGAGRFTEQLLKFKSASVTSADLSSAVDANQTNCPQTDRHRIIQCDINSLPFSHGQYDIVICLGVIQHTKQPERTIKDLYAQVKPGGWLVIDHYAPSFSYYTKLSTLLLRPILKRLSPEKGARATELITKLFFPLHRAARNSYLAQIVLSRFSPLLTFYHDLPQLNDNLQYEWALLDTHDSLTDYYKHLRTVAQITRLLNELGAVELWVEKGGNGVEARCRKPLNQ